MRSPPGTLTAPLFACALLVSGCAGAGGSSSTEPGVAPSASVAAAPEVRSAGSSVSAPLAPPVGEPGPGDPGPQPCGEFECRRFRSAAEALAFVVKQERPLVLAFGEAHTLADGPPVKPSAQRFAEELLPAVKDDASALVLELWAPDPSCAKEKVAKVEKQQKQVTEKQAKHNTNDYVRIGEVARGLGVVPFLLKPACSDYDQIEQAGADAILAMIDVITRNMRQRVEKLLVETAAKQPGKAVLTYGGALHNDVAPRPERASWSFAAPLGELSGGRYVELDLVIPEAIRDTPAWQALRWHGSYHSETMGDSVVLLKHAPRGYVLFFKRDPAKP